jgi:KDO2-lipid IV(A) lauroyltransferase
MNVHSARDRALDLAFAAGWKATNRLPERVAAAGFRAAADVAVRRQSKGVQRLRANLRRVAGPQCPEPEFDALVKSAMRSYGRYWLETFRLPKMDLDEVAARVEAGTEGAEHIDRAMAAGRGLILALPHMGNWDVAAVWLIKHGVAFTTVAERLKPESVYLRFLAFRESLGFEVLPATGGDSRFGVLAQRLRAGGMVCLPADRDVTGAGIEVEFFGQKARMMGGAAALAVQTGAALLPAVLWFEGRGWGVHIYPEVPVPAEGSRRDKIAAMTRQMARNFEAGIAVHPEDWHMLQRVFAEDFDPVLGLLGDILMAPSLPARAPPPGRANFDSSP